VLDALEAAARRSRAVRLAALLAAGATIAAALVFMRSRPPHDPAVAVLPFVNLSGDKENEYFSDGMTEELINALANVKGLRVASRTSAFAFKGKNLGIQTIGKELNVGAVLEGSIRREGGGLRIAAQLINAADGYHIWSATYDRELKNIFAVEEELARSIVFALKPRLLPNDAAPVVRRTTTDPAAHDLYLKGRYMSYKRNAEALRKAKVYFQQAIDKDPGYALAYLGLADATGLLLQYGPSPPREAIPQARDLILKALELDDGLAEAHVSFAAHNQATWNWSAAEREYRRAIELKPEYPIAHAWYASLLLYTGRKAEALAEIERARQLDPTSLNLNTSLALMLYATREYDRAIEQARKTLELEPGYPGGLYCLALVSLARGKSSDAVAILSKLEGSADYPPVLGYAHGLAGQRAEALGMLADFEARSGREYVASSARAIIYMGLGDKGQAFAWLDKAYADQDYRLRELKAFPLWDSLRSDPRFTRLLRQMHLEQ
jgi:serine/threonine-protein kinase